MAKSIKRVKIRRNRVWVTVLLFLLMSAVLGVMVAVSAVNFVHMTIGPMIDAEVETISDMETAYLSGEDISSYGKDYFITDGSGYIEKSGEDSCVRDISVEYSDGDKDHRVYPDKGSLSIFKTNEDRTDDFDSMLVSWIADTTYLNMAKDVPTAELDMWVASPLSGTDTMFVKTHLSIDMEAFRNLNMLIRAMGVTFIVIFVIMVINAINSIVTQNRLLKLFFTDPVTGGHNWNWFLLKGEPIVRRHKNKVYAIMSIGLEKYLNYCMINCTAKGEKVLLEVNRAISSQIRHSDICVHCNTSDHAVLVKVYDREDAQRKAQKILTAVESVIEGTGMTCHVGEYTADVYRNESGRIVRRDNFDIETAYNNARTARTTLIDGTNSLALFDSRMVEEQKWENTVIDHLHTAIENEEFLVYYQPKYDPRTDELRGVEALIRWQSPEYGFVTPNRFIPILENSGRIVEIDDYMISHTARDQRRWLDMGLKCVPVSVNVSRVHFGDPDLAEHIRDMVDAQGTPHELIEIELTESAFFDNKQAMLATISRLKEYGFKVSMDDFGSGYSSLNSLKDMPLDVLKLDAEFFRGDAADDRGRIVVAEAIKLARCLNMETVAEGVEEKDQVDFLAANDCDMIQGYFYAKPMPADEYMKRMATSLPDIGGEMSGEMSAAAAV
ncbi:MAG: EAL domain-containing protein [Oscillospiraceae bacterium]|nr:EAL domain-containing protein [Oscillospiraceae bacterium]